MYCFLAQSTRKTRTIRALTIAATLLLGACQKPSDSSVSVTADYLEVHGHAYNGPGNGTEGVDIYIVGLDEPIGHTSVDGEFRFVISDNQLYQAKAQEATRLGDIAPEAFNLLFDFPGKPRLMGISRPIRYSERGRLELGDINIGLSASVTGKVTRLHGDGDFTPEPGVKLWVAGKEALTTEQGHFSFSDLPAGSLQAYMLRKDHSPVGTELVLAPGEELVLPYPLVILPSNEVTGWLSPLPALDPAGIVAQSHPYRRSFKVHASPITKYIRYHHDENQFGIASNQASNPAQTWLPIRDKIHYDFPKAGAHKLYFQFADANQSVVSDVRILTATTDIFQDTTGMIIGDGSGIITSRVVTLQVDVPAAATEMRFGETPQALIGNLGWVKAQSTYEYAFQRPVVTSAQATLQDIRELYVQFRRGGDDIEESLLYRASARLQPFAGASDKIFTIHDGSGVSAQRVVDIHIDLPPNAWEMRIFTEQSNAGTLIGGVLVPSPVRTDLESNFIRAQPITSFVFLGPGRKNVFFQMRDRDGLLSPLYRQEFFVLPFSADGPGFSINHGAPQSITRDVTLEFFPPEGAVAFRVAELEETLARSAFQTLKTFHPMRLAQTGLRTVYVQFQDYDGFNSFVFSHSILIDPFAGDPGHIVLNGGSALTIFPTVDIDIQPPLTARDMRITLAPNVNDGYVCGEDRGGGNNFFGGTPPPSGDRGYVPVDVYAEMPLGRPGVYVICAQFRTDAGDESSFISRTIIYDPFPDGEGGIVINNGDEKTTSRLIELDIWLPDAAHKMRIANDILSLDRSPFEPAEETAEFLLPDCPSFESSCPFRILIQFQSVDGVIGPTFSDFITLDETIFPPASLTATINNGDATTANAELSIALSPPAAAIGVQIAESLGALTNPALAVQPTMAYTLIDTSAGTKTIYLRYESANGDRSPVFSDTIELVP